MNINFKQVLILATTLGIALTSCTKLEEKLNDSAGAYSAPKGAEKGADDPLLKTAFDKLRGITQPAAGGIFQLEEITTDEAIAPTRGGDWDDGGEWRALHNVTLVADESGDGAKNNGTFGGIKETIFAASDVLMTPSAAATVLDDRAQARLIRAYALYHQYNFWGKIAYATAKDADKKAIPVYKEGNDAMDFIIAELRMAKDSLTENGSPASAYTPSKAAASALLMRCYLNKSALAVNAAGARSATHTPDKKDMDSVVKFADEIIALAKYSQDADYFQTFAPNNGEKSNDIIFSTKSTTSASDIRQRWYSGAHYNMNPSGWNGFCTLGDFYDKFNATDKRRDATYKGWTDVTGTKVGFLAGQQLDKNGEKLYDRKGNLLSFTKEIDLVEKTSYLEVRGIRVYKYVPDIANDAANADNDCAVVRYSDVLLMKAEALLRGAAASTQAPADVAAISTAIGTIRGSGETLATLEDIYNERGREFYWEALRRTDMMRFGKFLLARRTKNKNAVTADKYLLFPIPSKQVDATKGFAQNVGY